MTRILMIGMNLPELDSRLGQHEMIATRNTALADGFLGDGAIVVMLAI